MTTCIDERHVMFILEHYVQSPKKTLYLTKFLLGPLINQNTQPLVIITASNFSTLKLPISFFSNM